MKRRSFFASLFAPLAVAQDQAEYEKTAALGDTPCPPTAPAWECGKAKNGQCPVCGTMSGPDYTARWVSFVLRCKRCNAAFFQDAGHER